MNLTFHSVTGVMMSQTVTAIISKFVFEKRLTVNQTMVITAYCLFLIIDAVNAIIKIRRLWYVSECECVALVEKH